MPGSETCSTSTAIARIPRAARCSSTFMGEHSAAAERTGGTAAALPAREPRLGVHQCELPSPSGREFPDHLIDAKRVIAWVREHGPEYGADPSKVFVAGSSAGGHLAALAALTPNDPGSSLVSRARTHRSPRRSASAASTARRHRRRLPSSPLAYVGGMRRRSSSRTATDTLVLSMTRGGSSSACGGLRKSRRLRRAARRSAHVRPVPLLRFEGSSMRSRRSPPGSGHATSRR